MAEPHAVVGVRPVGPGDAVRDAVVVAADGRVVGLQRAVGEAEALSELTLDGTIELSAEGRAMAGEALEAASALEALLAHDAHVVARTA